MQPPTWSFIRSSAFELQKRSKGLAGIDRGFAKRRPHLRRFPALWFDPSLPFSVPQQISYHVLGIAELSGIFSFMT